jgi:hypothetical protein
MQVLVIYESMYGNTHTVATHIGEALAASADVSVLPVAAVTPDAVAAADLMVVGGPTHGHTLSTPASRGTAVKGADKPGSDLVVEPDAEGSGLRDWFDRIAGGSGTHAAAFDTRVDLPAVLTGRASKGIARRLRHHGFAVVVPPESFLVDRENHLVAGEAERAEEWARSLVGAVVA